jgi:hypothetical protein
MSMSLEDVCTSSKVGRRFATPCAGCEREVDMPTMALLESLVCGHESRTP